MTSKMAILVEIPTSIHSSRTCVLRYWRVLACCFQVGTLRRGGQLGRGSRTEIGRSRLGTNGLNELLRTDYKYAGRELAVMEGGWIARSNPGGNSTS